MAGPSLALSEAQSILDQAVAEATLLVRPSAIAVVDQGGNLVAFSRMDGSLLGAVQLSIDRAFTACAFALPTGSITHIAQPGGPVYGINTALNGRVIPLAGGVPILSGDVVIGGLGVSGSTPDEDAAIALAATGGST